MVIYHVAVEHQHLKDYIGAERFKEVYKDHSFPRPIRVEAAATTASCPISATPSLSFFDFPHLLRGAETPDKIELEDHDCQEVQDSQEEMQEDEEQLEQQTCEEEELEVTELEQVEQEAKMQRMQSVVLFEDEVWDDDCAKVVTLFSCFLATGSRRGDPTLLRVRDDRLYLLHMRQVADHRQQLEEAPGDPLLRQAGSGCGAGRVHKVSAVRLPGEIQVT